MDRRLKERLVGAAILVILAVLLIPEFLSGPAKQRAGAEAEPVDATVTGVAGTLRTYRVDLDHPASGALLATDAAPVADHESQPEAAVPPAATGRAVEAASGKPVPSREDSHRTETPPVARHPAEAPPVTRHPAETPPVARHPADLRGGWWLQLGSFANKANAEKLARTLRAKGIQIQVSSSKTRHRVRAGPFADRAAAERVAAQLRAQGQASSIVPP